MTTIDTTRFRDALLRERDRVQSALENLHNENPGSVEDETGDETQDQHLGDAATAMHDRSLDYTLEDNEEHLLSSIDDASAADTRARDRTMPGGWSWETRGSSTWRST